ncbi:MAG TPA: uroporphyrinogen-III synthase, partial [Trueperaceae bacterium]
LLFPSPAAVAAWAALGLRWDGAHIGAVGTKTATALAEQGAVVTLVGEPQTAAGLAAAFVRHPAAAGPVGLPRGDRALPDLPDELRHAGYEVRPAVVYSSRTLPWQGGDVEAVVLASPSAVAALPATIGKRAKLVALGPTTARAVTEAGWSCIRARTPEAPAVVAAIEGLG